MARPGNIVEHEIAPTIVQDAIVQIMRSALGNRPVDMDMARDLAGRLTPAVQKMGFHGASGVTLSGNAAFHSLVAQHLGSPAAAAAYDPAFRKQMQQAIDTANIHGPHYLGGVVDRILLARAMVEARATDADGRRSGSSARFGEAGMPVASVPGNADARGIDIRNYYTSPVTRGLVDMGMTGKTFDHVRQQVPGASVNHIRDAGRDAKALRFGVNDEAAVKDHAIIRKHDPKSEDTNKALQDYQDRLDKDPVMAELMGKRKNAATPEERKALDQQIHERRQEHRNSSGVQSRMGDKTNPEQSREATGRRADEVDKLYEKNRGVGLTPDTAPTDQKLEQGRDNTANRSVIADKAKSDAAATPTGGNASRFRTQAQTQVAATPPSPNK